MKLLQAIEHKVGKNQWAECPKMPSILSIHSTGHEDTTSRNYIELCTEVRIGHTRRVPSGDLELAKADISKEIADYVFGDVRRALVELRYTVQSDLCSDQFNAQFDDILKEMTP